MLKLSLSKHLFMWKMNSEIKMQNIPMKARRVVDFTQFYYIRSLLHTNNKHSHSFQLLSKCPPIGNANGTRNSETNKVALNFSMAGC